MPHTCHLCSPDNPERLHADGIVRFDVRFTGPPDSGHGGMAVAALTCPALSDATGRGMDDPQVSDVTGRIRKPVPLESPLSIRIEGSAPCGVAMLAGDEEVVTGTVTLRPRSGDSIQPVPENLSDIVGEMAGEVGAEISGPSLRARKAALTEAMGVEGPKFWNGELGCYGCSEEPQALQISSWKLPSGDLVSTWAVGTHCIDPDGTIAPAQIIAALDCSNLWVLMAEHEDVGLAKQMKGEEMYLTGTHGVHFLRAAPADKTYRIITRTLGKEGRKAFTIAALFDTDGIPYAVAEDVLIRVSSF